MQKLTIVKIVIDSFTYLFIIACLIIATFNVDLYNQYLDLVTYVIYYGIFVSVLLAVCDEALNGGE